MRGETAAIIIIRYERTTPIDRRANGVRPDDRMLETGRGHDVAATVMSERLASGQLTAVNRSSKMIEATAGHTAEHVDAGNAEFIVAAPENLDDVGRFDRIFAVAVGLSHRHAERAQRLVEPWPAPAGKVGGLFDPPSRRRPPR